MSPDRKRRPPAEGKPPDSHKGSDATMRAVLVAVAGSAAVLTAVALFAFGARAALGVAIGGSIATANLYVFARIVQAFLTQRGRTAPWAVITVLKLTGLLGGVWLILRSEIVSSLSLIIGYSSLILGITVGTLFGPKPPETEDDPPPDA